jgi:hypothetical protein
MAALGAVLVAVGVAFNQTDRLPPPPVVALVLAKEAALCM